MGMSAWLDTKLGNKKETSRLLRSSLHLSHTQYSTVKFFSSHIPRLGVKTRISLNTAPQRQRGLRALLKAPTLAAWWVLGLEPSTFWSITQRPNGQASTAHKNRPLMRERKQEHVSTPCLPRGMNRD